MITGVTGLVGERLSRRFIDAGMDCRALVRSGKRVPVGVTAVEGDLLDLVSLTEAVIDVSAIIYLAAVFRTKDTDLIWKSNLDGTRSLIAAAKVYAPNVRFILVSTTTVYNANNPHPGREDDEVAPHRPTQPAR